MIIHLTKNSTKEDAASIQELLKENNIKSTVSYGTDIIIGVINQIDLALLELIEANQKVDKVEKLTGSYRLVSRQFHPTDTVIQIGDLAIGNSDFVTMAGPCSIESREQIFETAKIAAKGGAKVLRGGAFKPRTSPYDFQGLGEEGLKYIREAADFYNLKVITEVMDEKNLELVCKYTDILQIGARNMQNFRLLEAVGKTDKPVALKRGISGTINEWLHAAEYIAAQGNLDIIFVERGIRTYEPLTRNTFDLSAVPIIQNLSHLPIIVDPSHGVGIRDCIKPMALAGMAASASGMIIEIHPNPDEAWSDGPQSLDEEMYLDLMNELTLLNTGMQKIKEYRLQ